MSNIFRSEGGGEIVGGGGGKPQQADRTPKVSRNRGRGWETENDESRLQRFESNCGGQGVSACSRHELHHATTFSAPLGCGGRGPEPTAGCPPGAESQGKLKLGLIGCGWYGMVDAKAALKGGGV